MGQKQNTRLLKKAKEYIRNVFKGKKARPLLFHNRAHIESVVKISDKMAKKCSLGADDHLVLLLSAWFHDLDYLSKTTNHEKNSAEKVEEVLRKWRVRNDIIERVKATIQSSTVNQCPLEPVEQILADADQFYLGRKKFKSRNNLLRKEHEWLENKKISKDAWNRRTIEFMQSHSFHTDYARERLANRVRDNLAKLMAKLRQPDQQFVKVKPFI